MAESFKSAYKSGERSNRKSSFQMDGLTKIKLIGDSGVGKSSLVMRICDGIFEDNIPPTIGIDYKSTIMEIGTKIIKVVIWDTAGQERFRTVTHTYYRGSHGIAFVFDVSKQDTFTNIQRWLAEFYEYIPDTEKVIKMLIGNKIDLGAKREVSSTLGQEFARNNEMLYIETSAKTDQGVRDAFEEMVAQIIHTNQREVCGYESAQPGARLTTLQTKSMGCC